MFAEVVGRVGLRVHPDKTKIWGPNLCPGVLSEPHRAYYASELRAVGTAMPYERMSACPHDARDDDRTDVHVGWGASRCAFPCFVFNQICSEYFDLFLMILENLKIWPPRAPAVP